MKKAYFILLVLLAILSIQAVMPVFQNGKLDLSSLHDYENPFVPEHIFSEEVFDEEISDELSTLGRVLFYDTKLSQNSTISCGSCHIQEFSFGDTLVASKGFNEKLTERHATRLVNLNFAHMPEVFWDRRAGTLDSLPLMVLTNSIEMGFSGEEGQPPIEELVSRLQGVDYYKPLFEMAYGDSHIDETRVNLALTQFVRSIVSYDSRYDVGRAMVDSFRMDFPNFTELENRGKELYMSPFSEELTIPLSETRVQQGPQGPAGSPAGGGSSTTIRETHPEWESNVKGKLGCADCHGIDNFTVRKTSLTGNNGIVGVIGHPSERDTSVKRSPSLRNLFNPQGIEVGPYMHDGSLVTLEDVMDHYATIGLPGEKVFRLHTSLDIDAPNGTYNPFGFGAAGPSGPGGWGWGSSFDITTIIREVPPRIDESDTEALVAFLKTLSGTDVFTNEKWSDPFGEDGEFTLANDCQELPTREEQIEICAGDIYEGYYASGTYKRRIRMPNACDSLIYTELLVKELPQIVEYKDVCPGEDYVSELNFDQQVTLASSSHGCDTMKILNITNYPTPSIKWTERQTVCAGDTRYTNSDWYQDTVWSTTHSCYSFIEKYFVEVTPPPVTEEVETICEGEDHRGYEESGFYEITLKNDQGCDYIVELDLEVLRRPEISFYREVCEGESIEGYSVSGTHTDIFAAANGCDSIRTLELKVLPTTYSDHYLEICDGLDVAGYTISGTYVDFFTNQYGCDSIRTIELLVKEHTESIHELSICEGDNYEGYQEAGYYEDVFMNAAGCDSTRRISLEILEHSDSYYEVAVCEGEEFEGYSSEGLFTDILANDAGCDSTRVIDMVILDHTESYEEIHLCPGEEFEGYKDGDHEEYYVNNVGCDSTRFVSIVNIPLEDAVCVGKHNMDTQKITASSYLKVGPNPVTDYITIGVDKPERLPMEINIYTSGYEHVLKKVITTDQSRIDFSSYDAGMYMIIMNQGHNSFVQKLIKL